ncbi:MAG: deaminase, partial [Robiginitalea sp.]|nr:deaminase [Robiginitalea sp.]
PTAHAEITAIRHACDREKQPHLTGAVLYSNFEPCPMCLSAIYWADIRDVYYSSDRLTAERLGFMDRHLYEELGRDPEVRELASRQIEMQEMRSLLDEWDGMEDKELY